MLMQSFSALHVTSDETQMILKRSTQSSKQCLIDLSYQHSGATVTGQNCSLFLLVVLELGCC